MELKIHITQPISQWQPINLHVCSLSHAPLFVTPWTVAGQAPVSIRFPRQEYWSGLPFPSPGDLPDPEIEHVCLFHCRQILTTEPKGKPN